MTATLSGALSSVDSWFNGSGVIQPPGTIQNPRNDIPPLNPPGVKPRPEVYLEEDQGCWKDDNSRTIPTNLGRATTAEQCRKLVESSGKPFNVYGIQDGSTCFAGTNSDFKRLGKASACGAAGGPWSNRVYTMPGYFAPPEKNSSPPPPATQPAPSAPEKKDQPAQPLQPGDMGCWNERAARAVPNSLGIVKSVKSCGDLAASKGYDVYALGNGNECWGGTGDGYKAYGKTDDCSPMGGFWINHVYTQNVDRSQLGVDEGCWKEAPNRAVPNFLARQTNAPSCKALAEKAMYDNYAVSDGNECWGGNGDGFKKYGEASGQCQPLGGSWVNHVYSLPNVKRAKELQAALNDESKPSGETIENDAADFIVNSTVKTSYNVLDQALQLLKSVSATSSDNAWKQDIAEFIKVAERKRARE